MRGLFAGGEPPAHGSHRTHPSGAPRCRQGRFTPHRGQPPPPPPPRHFLPGLETARPVAHGGPGHRSLPPRRRPLPPASLPAPGPPPSPGPPLPPGPLSAERGALPPLQTPAAAPAERSGAARRGGGARRRARRRCEAAGAARQRGAELRRGGRRGARLRQRQPPRLRRGARRCRPRGGGGGPGPGFSHLCRVWPAPERQQKVQHAGSLGAARRVTRQP